MTEIVLEKLETEDSGREIVFEVSFGTKVYKGVVPREMLDDALSNSATEQQRTDYVRKNINEIAGAIGAGAAGSLTRPPFDRVRLLVVFE